MNSPTRPDASTQPDRHARTASTARRRGRRRAVVLVAVAALVAAACSGGDSDEPLDRDEAVSQLNGFVDDIDWVDRPVNRSASIPPPTGADLASTLPSIDEYPLAVEAPRTADVVVEIFASTEKSGEGTDGWMTEVAREFNQSATTLADGSVVGVDLRRIASGTGYQFIASGTYVPDGFSPSNDLWALMAGEYQTMTLVDEQTVPNVAGIVMKTDTFTEFGGVYGEVTAASLVDAVIAGDLVMGYTDPFASSTGLNFLVTVLDSIADGDADRLTAPDVASVFEQFQRQVPFVALTTLQMRDSVQNDTGTLDAFVMEWQTYANSESLASGYEFIPFGVRHDNPLYAVGELAANEMGGLEAFAEFASQPRYAESAAELRFDPPAYEPSITAPSGQKLIEAQGIWKDKKDGGRPVATVFVVDVSGSMEGTRVSAVRTAMLSAREFIKPETRVGLVEFRDVAEKRLDVAEFDLNQQARYAAASEDLSPGGGTAMYDGIVLGLSMLDAERLADPDIKPILVVLTDGETTAGLDFGDVDQMIEGLRIPIYTVGFEADLDELAKVSALVEAASIDASESDVEFKIAALFNAGG